MRKSPPVSDADRAAFLDAIGEVRRIESDRTDARPTPPRPHPRQFLADEAAVTAELAAIPIAELELQASGPVSWARNGVSAKVTKRLGAGAYAVRDEIDLHTMTAALAERVLADFLTDCRRRGLACVKVIHGKGLRSAQGPVLKLMTERMLRQRGDVLAFRSARAADGGSGAMLVLLRKPGAG
jgi:DNA-nicking Smr family endonuclease